MTGCKPLFPRGLGVRLASAAFIVAVQLMTGCVTDKPGAAHPNAPERHFPPNAFMTHRAIFTARGKQFALTGYLALSETGGKRLIISQALGQTMADLLVKPDGAVHVMQTSPMFKEQWIRRFVAPDLECLFGDHPAKKCPVQMLDTNRFRIKHFWYKVDLRIVETKVGPQPDNLFDPSKAQRP